MSIFIDPLLTVQRKRTMVHCYSDSLNEEEIAILPSDWDNIAMLYTLVRDGDVHWLLVNRLKEIPNDFVRADSVNAFDNRLDKIKF